MKTNHQRGFKANKPRLKEGTTFFGRGVFADIAVYAAAHHANGGNRPVMRSVRGAKKYINSRFRHHENAAAHRLAFEECEGD